MEIQIKKNLHIARGEGKRVQIAI